MNSSGSRGSGLAQEVVVFGFAEAPRFGGEISVAGAGAVVEGEEIVGHKIAIVLAQFDAAVVALQGQIHLALVEIGVAQVGVGSGKLGLNPNRLQQGFFG